MSTFLGIELGSTRIKAILIDGKYETIASGSHEWENRLENGVWTYSLDDVWRGLQSSYRDLAQDYLRSFGKRLERVDRIGISAMMHGYLPFDKDGNQLAPFRTWRNTMTGEAAEKLSELFRFNIPQRWSVAHLYQAKLNDEPHVGDIGYLTTLAGYVHWKLTGQKVLGIDDASGMFPVDSAAGIFNSDMASRFKTLSGIDIWSMFPKVLRAGEYAGALSAEGAKLLDPGGDLKPGIPLCPPEGDAGTGMIATNSVGELTGNISAGTSIFAMTVLDKELSGYYPEVDIVMTPGGKPVAMIHCNNCSTDLDAWVNLFGEVLETMGVTPEKNELYSRLYLKALEADPDCGGLFNCNYYSGEHLTGFEEGRPLFARSPRSRFNLANFMRAQLFSAMVTMKIGMDILTEKEGVKPGLFYGHGGLFKTAGVAQSLMASVLEVPVVVMESAGEGGAWGIALLAAYHAHRANRVSGAHGDTRSADTLESFLSEVFSGAASVRAEPDRRETEGFNAFMNRYIAGLEVERAAVKHLVCPVSE